MLSYAFEDLIENNDDLIDRMYSEVDAIETLQDVARGLVDEYQNVYNEAKTAVSEIHNFIQEEQGRAAAYAPGSNLARNVLLLNAFKPLAFALALRFCARLQRAGLINALHNGLPGVLQRLDLY